MSLTTSVPVLSPHRPHFYVALLAVSVLALAILIGRTAVFAAQQKTMTLAITTDALLTLPLAYWLLLVRPGHARAGTLLPVFVLSFVGLSLAAPVVHDLPGLKWMFIALEPILIGLAIWRIRRFARRVAEFRDLALPDRLQRVLSDFVGSPNLAHLMAMEISVIAFALGIVRRPPHLQSGQAHFTHHRRSGVRAALGAVIFICLAEAAVVHLLVARWNVGVAWVLTILSVYGALWLLGYLRSLSLLPSVIGPVAITLRNGLLQTSSVDPSAVKGLRAFGAADKQDPAYLGLTPPLTEPTHLLELATPAEVVGPFGKRKSARTIGMALDDPTGFADAIEVQAPAGRAFGR